MTEPHGQRSCCRSRTVSILLVFTLASLLGCGLAVIGLVGWSLHGDGYWGIWEKARGPSNPVITSIAIGDGFTFAGTGDAGIFRSSNGCGMWESFGPEFRGSEVLALYVDPCAGCLYAVTSEGLYLSPVEHSSWTRIRDSRLRPDSRASISGVSWASGSSLLISIDDALYRSTDGGQNWVQIPVQAEGDIWRILPTSNGRVLLFSEQRLLASLDGGLTWEPVLDLSDRDDHAQAIALDPIDASTVVFQSRQTLFFSQDGGISWARLTTPFSSADSIALTGWAPRYVLAVNQDTAFAQELEKLESSTDWDEFGFPASSIGVLAVDPADPARILAGTHRGVAVSSDNGRSWQWRNEGLEDSIRARDLAVLGEEVYAPSARYATLFSDDHGKTWQELDPGGGYFVDMSIVVRPGQPCQILRARPMSLSRSTDCGVSWSILENEASLELHTSSDDVSVIYGNDDWDGIVRSDDFGLTWRPVFEGSYNELAIDPSDVNHVYVASYEAAEGQERSLSILESRDGGGSWRSLDTASISEHHVRTLIATPGGSGNLFAGTESGAWQYLSSQDRWVQAFARDTPVLDIIQDPKHEQILYLCTSDGVFGSEDAGQTWVDLGPPFDCYHIALAKNGKILLVATEHEVYRLERKPGWWLAALGLFQNLRQGEDR